MFFVILLLIILIFIGFFIGFCVKKIRKFKAVVTQSQEKNVLNIEENGTYQDLTPTMIFHVIAPDGEKGIEGYGNTGCGVFKPGVQN